jgi:hypothetical protein
MVEVMRRRLKGNGWVSVGMVSNWVTFDHVP